MGTSSNGSVQHAVLWNPSGQVIDIGTLGDSTFRSGAISINLLNQVIGNSNGGDAQHPDQPFLWTESEGMLDLNDLLDSSGAGWTLVRANDINDLGQIVGFGFYCSSPESCEQRGFLLTPVPEPAAFLLLLAAAAMVPRRTRRVR